MAKIHGPAFLGWLESFGIVPKNTRRVVIDAAHDRAVMIYIEAYGTSEMIEAEPPPELRTNVTILRDSPRKQEAVIDAVKTASRNLGECIFCEMTGHKHTNACPMKGL